MSTEALIEDIRTDCEVARESLKREAYAGYLDADDDGGDGAGSDQIREERKWLKSFPS